MNNLKNYGASNNGAQQINDESKALSILIQRAKGYINSPSFDPDKMEISEEYYRNLLKLTNALDGLESISETKALKDARKGYLDHLINLKIKWYNQVIEYFGKYESMFQDDCLSFDSKKDVYDYAYSVFDEEFPFDSNLDFVTSSDGHVYDFATAYEKTMHAKKPEEKSGLFKAEFENAQMSLEEKLNGLDEDDEFDTRESREKTFFTNLGKREKLAWLTKKLWIEPINPKDVDFNSYIPQKHAIKRIVNILNGPRRENNCMILGTSGSGKSEIVNYIVSETNKGNIKELADKSFFKLCACNIEQRHIGETGESMMKLIKTFEENSDCILVIDEFAEFANNGGYQYDLTNNFGCKILPALSEGKIQVIGMETTSRYNEYMLTEHALCRRFKEVTLVEMKDDEAITLAKSMLTNYERAHKVKFIDKDLLVKRILNYTIKFYPGKANPAAIKCIVHDLLANIKTFIHKDKTFDLDSLNNFIKDKCNFNVTLKSLSNLSKTLGTQIIGQENAINHLISDLTEYMFDFESANRPLSLFFVGPTGVGKTESAKQLAKTCFKNENAMIKINMGDYTDPRSAICLFNYAYPLSKFIKSHPCGVIVFDEIEKADAEVLKVLLAALDEGIADDGRGNTLSLRGSVVIFTSNLGCNDSNKNIGSLIMSNIDNSEQDSARIKEALKDYFKPEFIGRIDHFITFKALSRENVLDILKLRLKELQASNSHYASIKVSDEELTSLIDKANVKETGARCIPNVLKKYLLSKLTKNASNAKEVR